MSSHRPRGDQPQANQAPGPQPNRNNNNRGNNRKEVADAIVDARDIINARRRLQLADNSDLFQALSRVFENVEYPKNFKQTNIQKYDGKQDPAQWLRLYSTAISVAGGDTNTKVLYLLMARKLGARVNPLVGGPQEGVRRQLPRVTTSSSYSSRPIHD